MKTHFQKLLLLTAAVCFSAVLTAQDDGEYAANYAREPRFRALVHYEPGAEEAHVQFDKQAIDFFHKLTYGEGWLMDVTTSLADYPYEKLKDYNIIISLNAMPGGKELFWEQIFFKVFKGKYKIAVRECKESDIVEIDTFSELKSIDKSYDV